MRLVFKNINYSGQKMERIELDFFDSTAHPEDFIDKLSNAIRYLEKHGDILENVEQTL